MERYAIAYGVIGFPKSSIRVKVTEDRDGYVWVRTADLMDAGTPLVLDRSQIEYELDWPVEDVYMHRDGLVALAG
jgi:hypothetical protein